MYTPKIQKGLDSLRRYFIGKKMTDKSEEHSCFKWWIFDFHKWSYYDGYGELIKNPSIDTLCDNSYRVCKKCKAREKAIKVYYWPSLDDSWGNINVLAGTNYYFKFDKCG